MKFHPNKCTKLTVINKRSPIKTDYNLHEHILASVQSTKYLGLTVTENLKCDTHIHYICVKANQTIGWLRRNLNSGSVSIKQQAYFSLVRPLVEYASTARDPYTDTSTNKLKIVQRWAARCVPHRHRNKPSVTSMLQSLTWRSLENRRNWICASA